MSTELILFFIQCFISIFVILNPFGTVPVLLSLTGDLDKGARSGVALKATVTALIILLVFALGGHFVFNLFHITLGAFRIAGGILLFLISLSMLYGQQPKAKITLKEREAAIEREDVAITPLGIPMIAGPGSIATVMSLMDQTPDMLNKGLVILAIPFTVGAGYLILRSSSWIMSFLGTNGLKVMTRLMGLMLAVIAVQFMINGLYDAFPKLLG